MYAATDQQLLQAYAASKSELAFAELVRRHVDLVYSAALRRIGDPHLAQDVTQGTFAALAQNARSLTSHPVLSGWLHRTTQNIATNLIRTSTRRHAREQEAVIMSQLLSTPPGDAGWDDIGPHLDAALDELDSSDRDAVMLRYFEKKSAHEVAGQLGISDDAAQKRVSRAVERLREFFAKRGITIGASGLVVAVSANAVQAAPVGLALTISTAAALTGTTLATTATVTATKAIAMTALQKATVIATIAVLAGVSIYETRQASQLREQVQRLQQQQAPMREQVRQLDEALADATNQLVALRDDNARLNRNPSELLRLRGEVGILRKESEELRQIRRANLQFAVTSEAASTNSQNSAKSLAVSKIDITRIPQQPQAVSEELIRSNISVTVGDLFDQSKVDVDVQNLYRTGLFYIVQVAQKRSDAGIALNYLIQEKPRLIAIKFDGNTKFREPDLIALLTSKVGEPMDEKTFFGDAQKIQERYARSGFGDTKVRYSTHIYENLGEAVATFEITE